MTATNAARLMIVALCIAASHVVAAEAIAETSSGDALAVRIDAALATGALSDAAQLIARDGAHLPDARAALARSDYALAANDTETAAAGYRVLVDQPAVAARAYLGLGLIALGKGDSAAAATALDLACERDPLLVRAWVARGVAADRQRDWDRAERMYDRALVLAPGSGAALTNRGYSRLLRGRLDASISDSLAALAIDPGMAAATNNLRLARAMLGDYKSAFAGSTKATLASDLNTVGFAAMSRGDYSIAESYFTRAMRISPQFDRIAWDNLVYLKELSHRPADLLPPQR